MALTGGAALSAAPVPSEPLKIGVVGLDYSYWGGIWADLLSPTGRLAGTSLLRMRPAYVWDKDKKKAQEFADRWDCEVVERYDGMVGKADGIVNGGLYNVPWQHLIMRPYIEAGIPCYLQRPWSNNLRNLDAMLDLAAKHSTPLIATATFEHCNEADNFSDSLKSAGVIQSVYGTAMVSDEPHFHLPYMLMKILGFDVELVSMMADSVKRLGYLNISHVYPTTAERPGFVVSMHAAKPDVFKFTVVGDKASVSATMPAGSSFYYRFFPQLVDIQKTFERKEHYQPLETVRKKFKVVQATYFSHVERGGAPVRVDSVPGDWSIPAWEPGWYDGSEFKS